jgi:hypothetical protein
MLCGCFLCGCSGTSIHLLPARPPRARDAFEVHGLDRSFLETHRDADWSNVFRVFVKSASSQEGLPPILGSWKLEGQALRFEPKFPLAAGVRYRAVLSPGPWTGNKRDALEAEFEVPRPPLEPKTVVEQVYPSSSRLPENQLKFYIHFSRPMRRREAYERIRILSDSGREVDTPFLELGEELWDPSGTRFTVFIDPGRVKRGLLPHDELGPVLEAGRKYALVIDRAWPDAEGAPLKEAYRKDFEVGAPDYEPPDPQAWKLVPPARGTTHPLLVSFPEPLDHALLQRLLRVQGPGGERVEGELAIGAEEREWRFAPAEAWKAGRYDLLIETILEDLAGNSIGRPFEVDVSGGTGSGLASRTVSVPFEVKAVEKG